MEEAGYPGTEEHLILHEELMKKTKALAHDATSYREPELALKFLRDWWLGHINKEDKQYAPYVKKKLGIQ